jgi:monovalent cation:H+ antiporter-2, CPA2 family
MSENVLADLVVAVLAAFCGGLVAERLRLPVVLGYLGAGILIGPFTPGFTIHRGSIELLAEIGVAFLMFAVGTEFSRQELRRLGRTGGLGGAIQILATMALGLLAGLLTMGGTPSQAIFLGALVALSSTVVALKALMSRGELESRQGRAALGILIAQDIAVVPMVVILPLLGRPSAARLTQLAVTAGAAVLILLVGSQLGTRIVPWLLGRVAIPRTRELFLLGVVALALGTALVTQAVGLSLAFGAFLAGLVMAESDYRAQVVAEALPFRDLFTSLFFVSIGMLLNPAVLLKMPLQLTVLSAIAIVGKSVIAVVTLLALRLPGRIALPAGLALAQVGEFSFVLARVGVSTGAIPQSYFDLILATSVVSVVVSPLLLAASPWIERALVPLPLIGGVFADRPPEAPSEAESLRRHVVICGGGRVGSELADALKRRKFPFVVLEYNSKVVDALRQREIPAIYGDASNVAVLEHARLGEARLLAVLMPHGASVELAVRHGRQLNPRLFIVARASGVEEMRRLRRAGANAIVQPEFEAGVEVIRLALVRYGIFGLELDHVVAGRRHTFYRRAVPE